MIASLRRAALTALAVSHLACGADLPPPPPPPPPIATAPAPAAPAKIEQAFGPADVELVFTDPDRRKKIAAAFAEIDAFAEAAVRERGLPSVTIGVVVDGELAHFSAAGTVDLEAKTKPDPDTVYRIASITKSFTALTLLSLRDEGLLSLEDPLTRALPEAGGLVYPTQDSPPITLRQVLTHTSGLPRHGKLDGTGVTAPRPEAETLAALSGLALDRPPGHTHLYSNLGYGLLGLVIGRVTHGTLRTAMSRRLLEPLGMRSTVWDAADVPAGHLAKPYQRAANGKLSPTPTPVLGALEGSGGLYSSTRDMARYLAFHLSAHPPRSEPDSGPLRRGSVREAHQSGLLASPLLVESRRSQGPDGNRVHAVTSRYAFGWTIDDTCELQGVLNHGGALEGYSSFVKLLPESGVGVVALTNAFGSGTNLEWLTDKVIFALDSHGGLSKRVLRAKALPRAFDELMPKLIGLINTWDEAGYRSLLGQSRSPMNDEQEELAGYRAAHAPCKGFRPKDILSPQHATFTLDCARGALELEVGLSPSGGVNGFVGTSRDIPAPEKLTRAAERIAGLIKRWDEAVYKKHLAPKARATRDETRALFARIQSDRGACKVKSFFRWSNEPRFTLSCERGHDITLELALDEKNEDIVSRHALKNDGAGACRAW